MKKLKYSRLILIRNYWSFVPLALMMACAGVQGQTAEKKPVPFEFQPSRIKVVLSVDPSARLDSEGLSRLVREWRFLVTRFIGSPWSLEVSEAEGAGAGLDPAQITVEQVSGLAGRFDQLWYLKISAGSPDGLSFTGRSLDVATARLGPLRRPSASRLGDEARALFELSRALFTPRAMIGASDAGRVRVQVQGAGLGAASELGQVVSKGLVLVPFRILLKPDGTVLRVSPIGWTYLIVEEVEGTTALCSILSSLRDPLTRRVIGKSELVALGVQPGSGSLRFQFVTRPPDSRPASGYVLTVRTPPDGAERVVGRTDRQGRVEVPPSSVPTGPLMARLVGGDEEPLVEFPILPGETEVERVLRIDPLTQAVALESRLNKLQDDVIDQVAIRSRLQALMESRVQGNAWDDVKALLLDYQKLPAKQGFLDQLNLLRDAAAKEQQELKLPVLTRTAQARLTETETLINNYLDDEVFQAYQRAARDAASGAVMLPGSEWKPFLYPGTKLTALFPGKPSRSRNLMPMGVGRTPLVVYETTWEEKLFQMGVGDVPGLGSPDTARAALLSIRDAIISGVVGARIRSQNEVSRSGMVGLDTRIEMENPAQGEGKGSLRFQILAMPDGKIVALSVVGAPEALSTPEVETFFNSLKNDVPETKAAAPIAAPTPAEAQQKAAPAATPPAGSTPF